MTRVFVRTSPAPMQRPFALPGARPRYAPDRLVDVEHIKLDVILDLEKKRIDGSCTTTFSPILEGARWIKLDAVEMEIRAVRLENGNSLEFSHDGSRLRFDIGGKYKAGEKLSVVIEYGAAPRRGLYFVGPDEAYPGRPCQVWSQGQDEDSRYWFPCFDAPHEKATSEVLATVPESLFALSNGVLVATSQRTPGTKTFHWRFDVPHSCYLISLAAGEFAEIRDRWEDVDVMYYVPHGQEENARRAMGRTPEMLALFSDRFGVRYPYQKYAQICVAEFIFGGMENTTATTLTDTCLFDERAARDYDVEALVAHELAHQWFGDLLTCRDWGQGWLNEGFATYSEYIWREHSKGRDEAAMELADWAEQYFSEDSRRYRRPIVTNVFDEPIDLFDHHLYEKGGLVLHMLRRVLGEPSFWKSLGHYLRKHRTGSVETRDLARAIEDATGRNVDWFFDQWVQKAGHPELKVSYSWDADAKLARLTVKQAQKVDGDTPLFRLPTEIRFRVGDKNLTFPVEVQDSTEMFAFPLESEPTQAVFDPGQHLLKSLEIDKPKNLWIEELKSATEGIDRVAAAKALAKHGSPDVVSALQAALSKDEFWGVRAAAAESLAQIRSTSARDALIDALATAHPKARRAVVRALGELRQDEKVAEALARMVENGDESYLVEAEACLSLGKTRSARAKDVLRVALTRESYLDVIRQHAYRGLAAARDDSAMPILLEGTRYGKVSHGRRAAIMALADLCSGRRDREAQDVADKLEELLADRDFRVQHAAVEGLATLGDPRAIGALRRMIERELEGRLKRRGREVIRDLTEGRTREEAVRTLHDDVERLRQEIVTLRERLTKLEATPPTPPVPPPPPPDKARARPPGEKKKAARAKKATALSPARPPRRPIRKALKPGRKK
ncbi:MAG: HEAT repeat domain-containing protein [Deltaproteobacteria bacterium]|nr:HEAT repeat domain-containing protein [Deltaproteobacteria bacterium]